MIEIIKTAPLNSVQDTGRPGLRGLGIARSGALDPLAATGANALLGNAADDAVLEFQMYPAALRFTRDTLVALTGADCRARLNGVPVPAWWVRDVRAGDELVLSPPIQGARCYVAVQGGVDVPAVLGSRSTALRYGFGGHRGRALQKGDSLPIGARRNSARLPAGYGACPPEQALAPRANEDADGVMTLRVMRAAEYGMFTPASQAAFTDAVWRVSAQSDRMGYRLSGPVLERTAVREMRSHPIVPGVVQVPPSGQPIIQLADGNSAGGYPKIGFVIDAELWRIAQSPPGTKLRFQMCGLDEARAAQAELESYLAGLRDTAAHCRVPIKG